MINLVSLIHRCRNSAWGSSMVLLALLRSLSKELNKKVHPASSKALVKVSQVSSSSPELEFMACLVMP